VDRDPGERRELAKIGTRLYLRDRKKMLALELSGGSDGR